MTRPSDQYPIAWFPGPGNRAISSSHGPMVAVQADSLLDFCPLQGASGSVPSRGRDLRRPRVTSWPDPVGPLGGAGVKVGLVAGAAQGSQIWSATLARDRGRDTAREGLRRGLTSRSDTLSEGKKSSATAADRADQAQSRKAQVENTTFSWGWYKIENSSSI